jgi:hypothetical protein
LRRIRRARVTLAQLPGVSSTSYRLAPSHNAKLLIAALRHENRRKQSSLTDLTHRLQELGWTRGAPDLVKAPLKRGAKNGKLHVLERYEGRATSRRKSAIRRFDVLSRREEPQGVTGDV